MPTRVSDSPWIYPIPCTRDILGVTHHLFPENNGCFCVSEMARSPKTIKKQVLLSKELTILSVLTL